MTRRVMPFSLVFHDRDQQLTLALLDNPVILTRDEADALAFHLGSFVEDMDRARKPKPSVEGADIHAEAHSEMLVAQYDDDPSPYHGDYSED